MIKKLKRLGISTQPCSALLKKLTKSPAHALLWRCPHVRQMGAPTKQPEWAVSSEVPHHYREHLVLSK